MRDKKRDMTRGVIWKNLLVFFLPILAGNFFQQFYTTADAVIVGQFVGKNGLAAVDSVYSLLKLPVNFFVGLSGGAAIIVSQLFGAGKKRELLDAVHTVVAFGLAGGAVLSVLGVATAPVCLRWLDVPEDIFPSALSYVRIYYAGFVFSMLYNIGAGVLRAVGNSQTTFCVLVVSGGVNVGLDLLFVGLFRWGVSGAALATAAAQMLSALLALNALNEKNGVEGFSVRRARFHRPALRAIVCLGLPVGLQSSLYPVANMMIQGAVNRTGTNNIAAWALCGKLDFMIWLAADSLAAAISTFVAQNYGAGQFARARRGVLVGTGMTASLVAVLGAALYLWNEPLGRLFVNPSDHDVIPIMAQLMRFLSPLYFVYVFGEAFSAAIRGAGETLRPMLLTLIATCTSRVLWILFVVPRSRGLITIVASYPVSWALTAVSFAVYYRIFAGKRLMNPAEEATGSY